MKVPMHCPRCEVGWADEELCWCCGQPGVGGDIRSWFALTNTPPRNVRQAA